MATCRQIITIIARQLGLAESSLVWMCDTLRASRKLPNTQGAPAHLTWQEIALVLLGALVGPPMANQPSRLFGWSRIQDSDGTTLRDALAGWLEHPSTLIRLTIDTNGPTATAVEVSTRTEALRCFQSDAPRHSFPRIVSITGDDLTKISTAIKTAPPIKAGRPSNRVYRYA